MPTYDVLLNKVGNSLLNDSCQRLSLHLLCEVINDNYSKPYLHFFPFGRGPIRSIPHWANDQGLNRGVNFSKGCLGITMNIWHLSHFFANSKASRCIVDQKYPYLIAL